MLYSVIYVTKIMAGQYFQRPSLQENTFQSFNENDVRHLGGIEMSFNNRNDRNSLPLHPINYTSTSEPVTIDNNYFINHTQHVERNNENYYPRAHSMHRNNAIYNTHNDLRQAYEARTGGHSTLAIKHGSGHVGKSMENHANLILSKMEQDNALMENSPESDELRREALRDMPQCLTIKRCVKQKLLKSVSMKSKRRPLSCYKMFKYQFSMALSKFKLKLKDIGYSFELWYGTLKKIEGNFGTGVASYFKLLRWLFLLNVMIAVISLFFVLIPRITYVVNDKSQNYSSDFKWDDIFTGEGFFVIMHYGFYTNQTLSLFDLTYYNMADAYFFTFVAIYIICFIILCISVARSYSRTFIETEGGLKNVFANKIFCGWDYNIATKDAAILKSKAIYNELRELLSDATRFKRNTSCLMVFYTRTIQIIINLMVLTLLAVTGYTMWVLLAKSNDSYYRRNLSVLTPILVSVVMTVFPMIFSFVVRFEDYSPKTALYITLVRTFLLGFVSIAVLVTFWLKNPSNTECWETSLGQEIYRLIIFDFIFSVIITPLYDVLVYFFNRYFQHKYLEFDIARNTMQIIYNQTLLWVGFFFSPVLAIIVVVKLLFTWYIRQLIVLKLCKPSVKTWRAAKTSTWFLVMAFLSLLLISGVLGYIFIYIPVSKTCGPFTEYEYIFEIVTYGVLKLETNSKVWKVLLYVTKPGVVALILIGLCGFVYYLRAKANAQRAIVAIYRDMLVWESKDKEFLLYNISRVTKGQWQYRLQDKMSDPVNTAPGMTMDYGDNNPAETSASDHLLPTISSSLSAQASSSGASLDLELDPDIYSKYKKFD